MGESLLSFSEVLLFGRLMDDLQIGPPAESVVYNIHAVENKIKVTLNNCGSEIGGHDISVDDIVLLAKQNKNAENGLYKVTMGTQNGTQFFKLIPHIAVGNPNKFQVVGDNNKNGQIWEKIGQSNNFRISAPNKKSANDFLDDRYSEGRFARIYGFSFEGTYYELARPTLFMVHGDGKLVSALGGEDAPNDTQPSKPARAPRSPEFGGVAAADFQFADDIRVWSYDKADYTIRMDVASGMFEQVLLEPTFYELETGISGAKVSGAKVSGAKVSGAKVSGAKVSGAKARGPSD